MKKKLICKCVVLGTVSCILAGCGNAIPELSEEESALVASYAADVVLGHSRENTSRLIDTEKESQRREELAKKAAEVSAEIEEEKKQEEAEGGGGAMGSGGGTADTLNVESISHFIGLDGFQVSYAGYEIGKSYPTEDTEWELTIDATSGKNLLIVKLNVTNTGDAPAVADVLSKNMMFHINGTAVSGESVGATALMTMLLNDFTYAQDEIGAGESKEYVLIIQIDEAITEFSSLSLDMKKDGESITVKLQ